MADRGFARRGRGTPSFKGGGANLIVWANFPQKLHENEEHWGASLVSRSPLDPPLMSAMFKSSLQGAPECYFQS